MASTARRIGRFALVASLLAVSATLLVPVLTGRPVVSYASSASMEPTIGVLDVFFVDPWPDRLAVGDIIVFRSVTQGGPAVHRIVGGSPDGWITQGDANAGPDQNAGEPLVTEERILGRVLTRAGEPIVLKDLSIPYLEANAQLQRAEAAAGGPRQLLALAFLLLAAASALLGALLRRPRLPPTSLSRAARVRRSALRRLFPRGILGRHVAVALLVLLVATTAWGAAHARSDVLVQTVVVQDASSADGVRAAAKGGTIDREIEVGGFGYLPTVVVLDAGGRTEALRDVDVVAPGAQAHVRVRVHASDEAGLQEDVVHAWRYPALLPQDAILALHRVVPGLPSFAPAVALGLVGTAWFALLGVSRLPVGRMLGLQEDWR